MDQLIRTKAECMGHTLSRTPRALKEKRLTLIVFSRRR